MWVVVLAAIVQDLDEGHLIKGQRSFGTLKQVGSGTERMVEGRAMFKRFTQILTATAAAVDLEVTGTTVPAVATDYDYGFDLGKDVPACVDLNTAEGNIKSETLTEIKLSRVSRVRGVNRYDTAANVASWGFSSADKVYLASGDTFADALTGSALAVVGDGPMVSTQPNVFSPDARAAMLLTCFTCLAA